jgi:hypothetical protein
MNNFSELEAELKKLRPARASAELISRIEHALKTEGHASASPSTIRPQSSSSGSDFRISWLGLGLGLAAAATFLILARVDLRPGDKTKAEPAGNTLASATPTLEQRAAALPNYQATGLTQVVYGRYDEGLVFPRGASQPSRRVWTTKRETLRWRDRETGAQLSVSYPAEEVTLTPVSGQ